MTITDNEDIQKDIFGTVASYMWKTLRSFGRTLDKRNYLLFTDMWINILKSLRIYYSFIRTYVLTDVRQKCGIFILPVLLGIIYLLFDCFRRVYLLPGISRMSRSHFTIGALGNSRDGDESGDMYSLKYVWKWVSLRGWQQLGSIRVIFFSVSMWWHSAK